MNCTALPSSPNDGWSNVPLPGLRNAGGYGKTASANCTPANSSSSLLSLLCCSEDTEQVLSSFITNLAENCKELKELTLNGNSNLFDDSVAKIIDKLTEMPKLETLEFEGSYAG